jgi:hypothetical protein
MVYLYATNCILIIHLAFITFASLGGFLVYYKKWMKWFHIPVALWAGVIEFSGRICPLTPLENYFRILAGKTGYDTGFIYHYLLIMIYPDGLTRGIQLLLGTGILIFNLIVYGLYFLKGPH